MMRIGVLALALMVGLGVPALPAAAQAPMVPGECPAKLDPGRQTLVCHCSADAIESGAVWGSDIYTDDSQLCRAARHAGALSADGGTVRIDAKPGRAAYAGKARNGVASSAWGSWSRSFIVARATYANSAAPDYPATDVCPPNAGTLASASLTCRCPADATTGGSVWGSGPYTADSNICRAARHAGRIGPRGGTVTVRLLSGRSSYGGSTANGVTTSNWGSYGTSYDFSE